MPHEYGAATAFVEEWWGSSEGIPEAKAAHMEAFFASWEERPVREEEVRINAISTPF